MRLGGVMESVPGVTRWELDTHGGQVSSPSKPFIDAWRTAFEMLNYTGSVGTCPGHREKPDQMQIKHEAMFRI